MLLELQVESCPIQDKRRQAEELEAKRKQHFRTMLMADKSFMEGEDDPFDGMSPQQIQEFIESSGIDVKDPFEASTGQVWPQGCIS